MSSLTSSRMGTLVGAVLALTWVVLGFWPFVGVAVGMALGALIGRYLDGQLDVAGVLDGLRGRRSSS